MHVESPSFSPLDHLTSQLLGSLRTDNAYQMQTECTIKGTLAFWLKEWERGLLGVRESGESPWLVPSILPPGPAANPIAAVEAVTTDKKAYGSERGKSSF